MQSCIAFYVCYIATILPLNFVPETAIASGEIVVSWIDAVIVAVFLQVTGVRLIPLLSVGARSLRLTALAAALLVPVIFANLLYHGYLEQWLDVEAGGYLMPFTNEGDSLWTAIVYIAVMPAVVEEIAFRGLIQTQLGKVVKPSEALVLTAVLFAIIHVSVFSGIYLFALGLLLGFLRQRSGSLVPGITLHFLHNLAIVLIEHSG